MYKSDHDEAPLKPIPHGGGICKDDNNCGNGGQCHRKKCVCLDRNFTGPFCQVSNFNDCVRRLINCVL